MADVASPPQGAPPAQAIAGVSLQKKTDGPQERVAESLLDSALDPMVKASPSLALPPHRGHKLDITV